MARQTVREGRVWADRQCPNPTQQGAYDKTVRIFPTKQGRSREVYHAKRMQRWVMVMGGDGGGGGVW